VGLDRARLEVLIREDQPDFVFWNTATPTLDYDLDLGRFVKSAAPKATTGVLGTHVTAMPEVALDNPHVDTVIRREPEMTITELCRHRDGGWHTIRGLSYREGENVHHNEDRDFLSSKNIPSPAWHYLDIGTYRLPLKGSPFLIVAPIRGCPYTCNFCTAPLYYGKRIRKRPVKDVVTEIEDSIGRFQVRDFFVWADTFTADKGYVRQFCQEIMSREVHISWTCNSRVDTVDREMLAMMKAAGLWMMSFGLESGSDEVLRRTRKDITVRQSRKAVTLAHQMGIRTSGHFMLGLPGETEGTMVETLDLALDLPLDIAQFYAAAPFPGTGLFRQALKNGWLRRAAGFSQSQAVMELPGLSAHRVDKFRRYAYRKFYMRPGALLNIFSMVESGAIANNVKNLAQFFRWADSVK